MLAARSECLPPPASAAQCRRSTRCGRSPISQLMQPDRAPGDVAMLCGQLAARWVEVILDSASTSGHLGRSSVSELQSAAALVLADAHDSSMNAGQRQVLGALRTSAAALKAHLDEAQQSGTLSLYAVPCKGPNGALLPAPPSFSSPRVWHEHWSRWQADLRSVAEDVLRHSCLPPLPTLLERVREVVAAAEEALPPTTELETAWAAFHAAHPPPSTSTSSPTRTLSFANVDAGPAVQPRVPGKAGSPIAPPSPSRATQEATVKRKKRKKRSKKSGSSGSSKLTLQSLFSVGGTKRARAQADAGPAPATKSQRAAEAAASPSKPATTTKQAPPPPAAASAAVEAPTPPPDAAPAPAPAQAAPPASVAQQVPAAAPLDVSAAERDAVLQHLARVALVPGVPSYRQRAHRTMSGQRKRWSEEEVGLLVEGLQAYGWGKWGAIELEQQFRERGRNPQDLRTKAEELHSKGKLAELGIRNLPAPKS